LHPNERISNVKNRAFKKDESKRSVPKHKGRVPAGQVLTMRFPILHDLTIMESKLSGKFVIVHGDHDYETNLPLEMLLDDDVLLTHS
jgi:hypothetical protein